MQVQVVVLLLLAQIGLGNIVADLEQGLLEYLIEAMLELRLEFEYQGHTHHTHQDHLYTHTKVTYTHTFALLFGARAADASAADAAIESAELQAASQRQHSLQAPLLHVQCSLERLEGGHTFVASARSLSFVLFSRQAERELSLGRRTVACWDQSHSVERMQIQVALSPHALALMHSKAEINWLAAGRQTSC